MASLLLEDLLDRGLGKDALEAEIGPGGGLVWRRKNWNRSRGTAD